MSIGHQKAAIRNLWTIFYALPTVDHLKANICDFLPKHSKIGATEWATVRPFTAAI